MSRLSRLLTELGRRKVVRVTGAYIVAVWLLAQGAADLFPAFGMPDWTVRALVLGGIVGIPLVALLSWRYDLTPRGIVKDDGKTDNSVESSPIPNDVAKWAAGRHDLTGTGYLTATWTGVDGIPHREQYFEPIVIGRDVHNDIQLADKRVSRRHTVLWAENGSWCARDLNSSNGTYIDGERIGIALLPAYCRLQFDKDGPLVELAVDSTEATLISLDGKTAVGARTLSRNR